MTHRHSGKIGVTAHAPHNLCTPEKPLKPVENRFSGSIVKLAFAALRRGLKAQRSLILLKQFFDENQMVRE
jgi:hypothetical protein